jgi:hypothetical protein
MAMDGNMGYRLAFSTHWLGLSRPGLVNLRFLLYSNVQYLVTLPSHQLFEVDD